MINHSAQHRAFDAFLKLILAVCGVWLLLVQMQVAQAQDKSAAEIRGAIKAIWDKPGALVEVDPVSVVGNYAMAGWTQEKRGGRALLRREHGKWSVIVCGGDGLAKATALRQTGMSAADAANMEKTVAKAEAAVPEARRKMFALFEGTVKMDGSGHHAAHGTHSENEGARHKH